VGVFFAALVDQIVLVTRESATRKRDVNAALAILQNDDSKIKGIVLANSIA
jgi:Mrp family chromosome partitioning ATPase